MNPLLQGHSVTTPETSSNVFSLNQGANEDESQGNLHPEAGIFDNQMAQSSGPDDRYNMVTGVQRESLCGHDMVTRVQRDSLCGHDMMKGVQRESLCGHETVTGATEQSRSRHDMTGVHEEVTYCSPSTFSGEQKKLVYKSNAIPQ